MAKPFVLVADADPRSLRILEVALHKARYEVATVADAAAALHILKTRKPDVVLCDAQLPGEDGYALCRLVRADPALEGMPFLIMSADKSRATKAKAIEAGADDFLGKPLLLRELASRLHLLVEQREIEAVAERGSPAGLTGEVADLGLVDLFQSLDAWGKTGVVICEAPDGRAARVWVRDGQVIDAEVWPLAGEAAFWRLLTWESGSFRADFAPVERERRIEGGTQAVLMEAMRRVDELARAADELPPGLVLGVDVTALASRLAALPDEVNGVVRAFDGSRTLREALARSTVDDLNTLAIVRKLLEVGVLRRPEAALNATPSSPGKPSLEAWLMTEQARAQLLRAPVEPAAPVDDAALDYAVALADEESPEITNEDGSEVLASTPPEPEPPVAPAAPPEPAPVSSAPSAPEPAPPAPGPAAPLQLVRFPPLRGVRRERLRREADEGRQAVAAGQPVRLTRVVELPAWEADGRDALDEGLRRMSPAAGDAARTFAPDAPLAKVAHLPQQPGLQAAAPPAEPPPSASGLRRWLRLPLRRRNATLAAAILVVFAVLSTWLLWPQPKTERKAAPWLEPGTGTTSPEPQLDPAPELLSSSTAQGDDASGALRRGNELGRRGLWQRAIAEYRKAAETDPSSVPALLALGDAYLEADQPKSAAPPLAAAAQLDPNSPRAQLLLGTTYQSLGRRDDAVQAFARYLALEPDGEYASEVRSLLANLGP